MVTVKTLHHHMDEYGDCSDVTTDRYGDCCGVTVCSFRRGDSHDVTADVHGDCYDVTVPVGMATCDVITCES